ncbi:MAG: hypothetical protein QMB94_06280, partial [Phycisphaerales bacterium]
DADGSIRGQSVPATTNNDFARSVDDDPELATCPFYWPIDPVVASDGPGEGLPGFKSYFFLIDVLTPGGGDFGSTLVYLEGESRFDTSTEIGANVNQIEPANGDVVTIESRQFFVARIQSAGNTCTWTVSASTSQGFDAMLRGLRSIASP